MLEPMAAAAADQHDVRHRRMTIDQKVAVRAVLILTDARFGRGARSSGKRRSRKAMILASADRVGSRDWVSGSTTVPCVSWANFEPRPSRSGKP